MTTAREQLEAEVRALKPDEDEEWPAPFTVADIDDSPLEPLLLGMLEPHHVTLLYGPGAVGKGLTMTYHIVGLLKMGMRPRIYDAEGHPREWRARLEGLGADISMVDYTDRYLLPPHLRGASLHEVAEYLPRLCQERGNDALFVDSVMAAMNSDAEGAKSDPNVAYNTVEALEQNGLTSELAHHTPSTTGVGMRAKPYGSVAWQNAPRLAWSGTVLPTEVENQHRVRWESTKHSLRAYLPALVLPFDFSPNSGRPMRVTPEDEEVSTGEWLLNTLKKAGPHTIAQLVALKLKEDEDSDKERDGERLKDNFRHRLAGLKTKGHVERSRDTPPLWSLKEEA